VEIYLETDRLLLRRFTEDDAGLLIELDSDPDVMRYLTGGQPTPPERIRTEVLPRFAGYYQRWPGYGYWAAHERTTGDFVGWFCLRPKPDDADDEPDPELGYRLRKAAWGKGYATEASLALIHKGFAELGARRIYAQTMAVNTGSRHVMEKVGLKFVRNYFEEFPEMIEGSEHGEVEYALEWADWEREQRLR
jgi:RimJ/RimL family protein N-acetyltransferase